MVTANIPQAEWLSNLKKYRAFVGGFGSGKTFVGCMDITNHACKFPGINQGYFAPQYSHIRDIFYPTVDEVVYNYGLRTAIRKGDKEVDILGGKRRRCTVIARSMDNPASIIGFKIGNALIDEMDVLPIDKATHAWQKIIARMRYKDHFNRAGITTTPEGFRFVHKQFVEAVQKNPALADMYGLVQCSTYDNEANLNDDYIDALLATYPEELIQAYLLGQFVNLTSGTVFYAFDRRRNGSYESIKEKEPLHIGMDFNVSQMSAVVYVHRGDQWHAVDELSGIYDTPAMISTIKEKYPEHVVRVYPDPTGKNRETVNASTNDIALLEAAGLFVYAHRGSPSIKGRVLSTNVALQQERLYVNVGRCPEFTKSLEQLAYDKNGMPDKSSGLDHITDAGTYPIEYSMPVKKPPKELQIKWA